MVKNKLCSDDGFDYFRGWLISRGEEVFNQVIKNPEFLAEYLSEENLQEDVFAPQLEEMLFVASDAYTYRKTGMFEYNDDIDTEFSNELEARGYSFEVVDIELDWEIPKQPLYGFWESSLLKLLF